MRSISWRARLQNPFKSGNRTAAVGRLDAADVALLACPDCRGSVAFAGTTEAGALVVGFLRCRIGAVEGPVRRGLPGIYRVERGAGSDRLLRLLYNPLARLHDPMTTALTPFIAGISEREGREHVMRRLDLGPYAPTPARPLRILEIGIGGGAQLEYLRAHLGDRPAEIWGVDLSEGMLDECKKRVARDRHVGVRLLFADGHALPFPDGSFDRVLNVGGIGGYRDPAAALAEMARVAVRGTPIVVVDEQLDRSRKQGLLYRAAFRALTFYAADPRSPRAHLPAGAYDIVDEQPARCYYCLTFRMPGEVRR
jgi:ubiquinone/menaquinone biosynthesis C-methylase UbiE